MLHPELEKKLRDARCALDTATSENVIELGKQYLALLAEYRSELYKLSEKPGSNLQRGTSSSSKNIDSLRKAVRLAIEKTTGERNRTEALLRSFTAVSGYEAAETFNQQKYKGYESWELRAGGVVRYSNGVIEERLAIQEAVDEASLLRRQQHRASETFVDFSSPPLPDGEPYSSIVSEPIEQR